MENRLYVGNLSDDVSAEALRKRFAEFGNVADVHLAVDRSSGRMRGHAFVTMASASEAQNAMAALNGANFDDRRLRVNLAGEDRDQARANKKAGAERAKITSQFRERLNMAYELDCGGVSLAIKIFPEDAREEAWRIEASTKGATPADGVILSGAGTTRGEALEALGRSWQENRMMKGLATLDWVAITDALVAVRAV